MAAEDTRLRGPAPLDHARVPLRGPGVSVGPGDSRRASADARGSAAGPRAGRALLRVSPARSAPHCGRAKGIEVSILQTMAEVLEAAALPVDAANIHSRPARVPRVGSRPRPERQASTTIVGRVDAWKFAAHDAANLQPTAVSGDGVGGLPPPAAQGRKPARRCVGSARRSPAARPARPAPGGDGRARTRTVWIARWAPGWAASRTRSACSTRTRHALPETDRLFVVSCVPGNGTASVVNGARTPAPIDPAEALRAEVVVRVCRRL